MPNEGDVSRDVTDEIKAFYEANPFPNYDDFDDTASLVDKSRTSLFAKLLDEQIPHGARVIECGCGTGQLTNFLSVATRTVVGTDFCLNSLKMATAFKAQNALDRAHFLQMNLFRPCFRPRTFDLVISNGVLHHTSDPGEDSSPSLTWSSPAATFWSACTTHTDGWPPTCDGGCSR